ncbi:hypothetical protein SCHPADRAFT_907062 [Schizopora paradoxa]|uniref:Peroxisome membrane anchor protein Pex14p N-terminal domain-containing protein n=1 Tax=Schizopora paradoxa TaxID=27342 RepID=A0A0H2RF88_9AGAM|nr:hypothetical protein SCHPADRAFT_907062 [Schizopora paradoxa]
MTNDQGSGSSSSRSSVSPFDSASQQGDSKSDASTDVGNAIQENQVASGSEVSSSLSTTISDRSSLIERARSFLRSPQIRNEDPSAKRGFLQEKGMNPSEIEMLMREQPLQVPPVPPRTYPQPPPSNLPYILLGMAKLFTWLTGASAVLVLIYYRFLFPRVTRTALARLSLKQHQIALLSKLRESLGALKEKQAETFAVLPQPPPPQEERKYKDIHCLEDLNISPESEIAVPEYTLLRCAIQDLAAQKKPTTKEELFSTLESRYPWLTTEKGIEYESSLWDTLNNNPDFSEVEEDGLRVWMHKRVPPPDAEPSPLINSVTSLKNALPTKRSPINPYQHTLDTLTDFTGYITTQTYQMSTSSLRLPGVSGSSAPLDAQQEEVRREIRALKGLVLNRRTFAPSPASGAAARVSLHTVADNNTAI